MNVTRLTLIARIFICGIIISFAGLANTPAHGEQKTDLAAPPCADRANPQAAIVIRVMGRE